MRRSASQNPLEKRDAATDEKRLLMDAGAPYDTL